MATELTQNLELDEIKELKERIKNNKVVEYWENSDDFERLANTTVKTMKYVNDEQLKEFAKELNNMNEKILNLTFEGVKKHYEKQNDNLNNKRKLQLLYAFGTGVIVGALIIYLFMR